MNVYSALLLSGRVFSLLLKLLVSRGFTTATEMQLQPSSLGPDTGQKQLLEERIHFGSQFRECSHAGGGGLRRTAVYGNGRVYFPLISMLPFVINLH